VTVARKCAICGASGHSAPSLYCPLRPKTADLRTTSPRPRQTPRTKIDLTSTSSERSPVVTRSQTHRAAKKTPEADDAVKTTTTTTACQTAPPTTKTKTTACQTTPPSTSVDAAAQTDPAPPPCTADVACQDVRTFADAATVTEDLFVLLRTKINDDGTHGTRLEASLQIRHVAPDTPLEAQRQQHAAEEDDDVIVDIVGQGDDDDDDNWVDAQEDAPAWELMTDEDTLIAMRDGGVVPPSVHQPFVVWKEGKATDVVNVCAPVKLPQPRQEVATAAPAPEPSQVHADAAPPTTKSKTKKKRLLGHGRTGARR
jgi:hypothetical protein